VKSPQHPQAPQARAYKGQGCAVSYRASVVPAMPERQVSDAISLGCAAPRGQDGLEVRRSDPWPQGHLGTSERPRLASRGARVTSVAQVIDDGRATTLASASTLGVSLRAGRGDKSSNGARSASWSRACEEGGIDRLCSTGLATSTRARGRSREGVASRTGF